nr:sulfotransferase domain-containing protein [Salinibacter ruber]
MIVGAQRSGSTFLHDCLALGTSAVPSSLQKEVHYFDNKFYRSLDWYARFFRKVDAQRPEVQTYEASPYYLFHPTVPKRVNEHLPDTKILAVLRDPVERAVSHYKWMRQVGLEKRSAEDAFRHDADRMVLEEDRHYLRQFEDPLYFDFDHIHRSYLRRSMYHTQLERWLEHFDPLDIRVVRSQDLFSDTEAVLKRLSRFLGLEYTGYRGTDQTNTNESRDDIAVEHEACQFAERVLAPVRDRMQDLITPQMRVEASPEMSGSQAAGETHD